MIVLGPSKAVVLTLGLTISAPMSQNLKCTTLEGLYHANVETVGAALQAFEQCTSIRTDQNACSMETRDLLTAREELQAAFQDYLKTCASRLARRKFGGEAVATSETDRWT